MHARRILGSMALALAASTAYPVVSGPAPAVAHTGFTSRTDDANGDFTPTINGTTMKVRVLRPTSTAPTGGWPLVVYMPGDFENRCSNLNETSTRTSWYTRKQMAEHGFAVLSFNARGIPANYNAGLNSSGVSGCSALDDAKDLVDDSGWDVGGPTDKQDIDDLVEWAVANYNPNTTGDDCASGSNPCINGDQVGLFGYGGIQGLTSLLMGVPNPPNSQYNSRVKGIVAVGYGEFTVRNLTGVSNDGAGTPAFRDVDQGTRWWVPDADPGYYSHADSSVFTNVSKLLRAEYLNYSVPSSVATWLDDRTVVDDTASIDKAAEITTPVFMANAFLDGETGTTTATLAYNKLGATSKYLYLGACGSSYDHLTSSASGPCLTTNATNLRDKVHAFLDLHVKQDTTISVGGPVFWAVPPATSPLSTDNWSVASDTTASWPPAPDATSLVYCLDSAGEWLSGACSTVTNGTGAGLQDTGDRTISNVLGIADAPLGAFCTGATYGSTEVVSYTSGTDTVDNKMIGFEADVSIKSDTTRLQVYADLFTVDGSNVETRVWQGSSQAVPVKRDGTAGTVYRFKFRPAGAAWTLKAGHLVRLKIAANYKKSFAQELLPATYTLKHTDTNPTQLTITWDL